MYGTFKRQLMEEMKKIKTYIFIIWLFNKNEQWQKVIEQ